MTMADAARDLDLLIRSRYPIIYLKTWEEDRAERILDRIAKSQRKNLVEWTATSGLRTLESHAGGEVKGGTLREPLAALDAVLQDSGRAIYVFKDIHLYLDDKVLIRKLRDLYDHLKRSYKTLVLMAPVLKLPTELEKSVYIKNLPPPEKEALVSLLKDIVRSAGADKRFNVSLSADDIDRLAEAAMGLTLDEAERVFSKALIDDRSLTSNDIPVVREEKEQIVHKSGVLEYYHSDETMDDVGGLEGLKDWLAKRGRAFTAEAIAYGLPKPRGMLLLGVQGCGKSLAAKAVASLWRMPLLRLDMSRIFGSLMGSSEQNMRKALDTAESVSPAVLWVDEIEKTFSGTESSGMTDAGTTARVFGSFLTWLQENRSFVFCVATANSIEKLPPELLRKGRFDEIFFVDLPTPAERGPIFRIHLAKRRREPAGFDVERFAEVSEGYSGAEIEQAIVSAMYDSFAEDREVTSEDIISSLKASVPLSVTRRETIEDLRLWAKERARMASKK